MTIKGYVQADESIDFDQEYTNIISGLPLGVYVPRISPTRGIYLSKTNDFQYLPEYYLLDKFEEYVLTAYKSSSKSIGASYLGLKGSGKTKRAHKLALDSGLPIIYLQDFSVLGQSGWKDIIGSDLFNDVVVFIDEYEKKLKEDTTIPLLEWLDGSVNTKQLFILIGNEQANNRYANPLVDRLSRVLFKKTFDSLSLDNIKELVTKLSLRHNKDELVDAISCIPVLSLDNCLQIIKTTNLFIDEPIDTIIGILNIEFREFEDFVVCDLVGNKIVYDSISVAVTKGKVAFRDSNICLELKYSFGQSLDILDIDNEYSPEFRGEIDNKDIIVEYVNPNTINLTGHYYYYKKGEDDQTRSVEPITIQLIKESVYQLSNSRIKYLTF